LLEIDAALVSKFESGARKPTRQQVYKIAEILDLDLDELMVLWLKVKILFEVGSDDLALKATRLQLKKK
jgi:transcriptional regulator with XRE-family HTH domain